jgi:hypothetical protein
MKKFKGFLITMLISGGVLITIYGLVWVKYKIWRAEHPQAQTWTFFVPSGSN